MLSYNIGLVTPLLGVRCTGSRRDSTPPWPPRLVERNAHDDGNVTEVFEVAPGELVVVESWSIDETTTPEGPRARR